LFGPGATAQPIINQMKNNSPFAIALALALVTIGSPAQDADMPKFDVLHGPATAKLGAVAQIEVPGGYTFIDGKTLNMLMKSVGEPVHDGLLGSIDPTNESWSVMFTYDEVGYVKDDDKNNLNADKLLQDFKEGTEQANKVRAKSGIPPIHVIGWEIPPRYNEVTHNLEWALRGTSEGRDILNFDTRLLGRKGYMAVKLIVDPDEFAATLPAYTNLMAGYKYQTGETYAEYRPGDKVAKYGLAALVAGGAAVGAAKLGLFAWLAVIFKKGFKVIIIALIAVVAMFKNLFAKILGRRSDQ
jgi:uncharacterized membrane-anchored protein